MRSVQIGLAIFASLVHVVFAQLTTWDNQLFDFGWNPYNPTIVRCSTIGVSWSDRAAANPQSQAPYSIYVLRGGYQPILVGTSSAKTYNWNVQLPTGGPYLLYMTDANGYTGGTSLIFTVTSPAGGNCATTAMTETSLRVTNSGGTAECSTTTYTVDGGTAPYNMQVMVAQRPPKTTTWTTSQMTYVVDIQPSEQFFVKFVDANGAVGLGGLYSASSGDPSCYGVASTIRAGASPTTLAYNAATTSSTSSSTTSTTSSRSTTDVVINNTGQDTVTSVITLPGGSTSVVVVAPNSQATVASNVDPPPPTQSKNLPVIVGSVVGGVGLVLLLLILFFLHRRRAAAQRKNLQDQQEAYDRRRLSNAPNQPARAEPFQINPPPMTARESVPLLASDLSYSNNASPSPPATSMSFYSNNTSAPGMAGGYAPWAHPEPPLRHGVSPANSGFSSIPPTHSAMHQQLPPGAAPAAANSSSMFAANSGEASGSTGGKQNFGGTPEKATFRPPTMAAPAPPPYQR